VRVPYPLLPRYVVAGLSVLVEGQLPAGTDPALVEQQCALRDVVRAFSRGQEWERVEALAAALVDSRSSDTS
jgi:hypothetical protein